MRAAFLVFVVFSFILLKSAFAARKGVVEAEGAEVRQGPGIQFRVIDRLKKGAAVQASNLPTDGFYKVRTPRGEVGWMAAEMLSLGEIPPEQRTQGAAETGTRAAKLSARPNALRVLFGIDAFEMKEFNDLIGFDALKDGNHFGLEYRRYIREKIWVGGRVEQVYKSFVSRQTSNGKTYEMGVSSWPVMGGAGYLVYDGHGFHSTLSAMLGLGLSTKLSSTSVSDPSPRVTEYSSTAFAGLLKADLAYSFNELFSLSGELGYRILSTGRLDRPSTEGNGREIFQQGGNYVPASISFSGLFFGIALGFSF